MTVSKTWVVSNKQSEIIRVEKIQGNVCYLLKVNAFYIEIQKKTKSAYYKHFLIFKIFPKNNYNSNKTNVLERNKDQLPIWKCWHIYYTEAFIFTYCSINTEIQFLFFHTVQNN
jgi:hypothetical protein